MAQHHRINDPLTEHLRRVQNEEETKENAEFKVGMKAWVHDRSVYPDEKPAKVEKIVGDKAYMKWPDGGAAWVPMAELKPLKNKEETKENAKVPQKFKKGDRVKMIDDTEGLGIGIIQYYEGIEDEGSPVQHIKWSKGESSSERENVLKKVQNEVEEVKKNSGLEAAIDEYFKWVKQGGRYIPEEVQAIADRHGVDKSAMLKAADAKDHPSSSTFKPFGKRNEGSEEDIENAKDPRGQGFHDEVQKAVDGYQIPMMQISKVYRAAEQAFDAKGNVTKAVHACLEALGCVKS